MAKFRGRRTIPRWSDTNSNPPSDLLPGEIVASLPSRTVYIGTEEGEAIALNEAGGGITQPQLDGAIATETTARQAAIAALQLGFNYVGTFAGLPSSIPNGFRWLETPGMLAWEYSQGSWLGPSLSHTGTVGGSFSTSGQLLDLIQVGVPHRKSRVFNSFSVIAFCNVAFIPANQVGLRAEVRLASASAGTITGLTDYSYAPELVSGNIFRHNLISTPVKIDNLGETATTIIQNLAIRSAMSASYSYIIRSFSVEYREVR